MVSFRRPSGQATAVVLALAVRPATWRYGYELCQRLDLEAGTLYPALMRLADRGQLEPAWESEVPAARHATCTGSPVPAVCWQGNWRPSRRRRRRWPGLPVGSGGIRGWRAREPYLAHRAPRRAGRVRGRLRALRLPLGSP